MKFGYYLLNTYVPELDGDSREIYSHWMEQIDAAEDMRFDSLWVTEHHFRLFGGMMPSPQMLLSAASQRTRRLRLGSAVSLVPMHHPLQIAEDYAMLDLLCEGRLLFGAGRGMSPHEYEVYGYDWSTAQPRLVEALDVIRMAWTEEAVEWEGEYFSYHGMTVRPRPVQQPHPPIYVPANRDLDNFRMIGRNGYHLMTLPWIGSNAEQRPRIEVYLESLREAGFSQDDHDVFVMYPIHVGEDDRQARADVEDAWHRWREFALDEVRLDPARAPMVGKIYERLAYDAMVQDNRGVFGGPETCIEHLKVIIDVLGPTHIGLCFHFGGLSHQKVLASMERFSRHVAPAF